MMGSEKISRGSTALCVERVGKRTSSTPLRKKVDTTLASGLIQVQKVQASWALNRGCVLIAYASSTWGTAKGAAIRNVLCWSRADNADTQTVGRQLRIAAIHFSMTYPQ
jgi:hypothetical protein